jgi:hypothetical protein
MGISFTISLSKDPTLNATGITVPEDVITKLGSGKKPKVKVSINGYTYRSTVAVMGGEYKLPVSQAHREAAGVKPGDTLEVTLELDLESRRVEIPDDLKAALSAKAGALETFDKLSDSRRKEFVRQVEEAKAQDTRDRRVAGIVAKMGDE